MIIKEKGLEDKSDVRNQIRKEYRICPGYAK
jgi:hypothetical protein